MNLTTRALVYSTMNDELQRNDEGPVEDDQTVFERGPLRSTYHFSYSISYKC